MPPKLPLTPDVSPPSTRTRKVYVAPTVKMLGTLDDRTLGMNGSNPDAGQGAFTRLGGH